MTKPELSKNIHANVGGISGWEFQDNGTERFKGSHPLLVRSRLQIEEDMQKGLHPLLESYNVSRFCGRYFVDGPALTDVLAIQDQQFGDFNVQVEAAIPFSTEFPGDKNDRQIYWVWIGGNLPERKISERLRTDHNTTIENATAAYQQRRSQLSEGSKIQLLGRSERLTKITPTLMLERDIEFAEMTQKHADQIAKLYKDRLPVYVADNGNPAYIKDVVAASTDSYVFALIDPSGSVAACVANEFCHYPLVISPSSQGEVVICESNDWVKRRGVANEDFRALLQVSLADAIARNPHIIEAECVPESFRVAGSVGFSSAGLLERTSKMQTDGKNLELFDSETPLEFRKFNSLWLMSMTPTSPAWRALKILE